MLCSNAQILYVKGKGNIPKVILAKCSMVVLAMLSIRMGLLVPYLTPNLKKKDTFLPLSLQGAFLVLMALLIAVQYSSRDYSTSK